METVSRGALPDLADALSVVWPDHLRTCLLRACLITGPEAERAWGLLAREIGDPKPYFEQDLSGLKGLLPILHAAARRNRFALDSKMWTYLRSAGLREELRNGVYRKLCADVLSAMIGANLPVIALKACALSETIYESPGERHCHAIDLLVPADALPQVAPIVRSLSFRPARILEARPGARRGFRHESGLPLVVHAALCDPPVYPCDTEALWSQSSETSIAGVPVGILAPAHNLFHVLTSAFHDRARRNLRWACDASLLVNKMTDADWVELVRFTQYGRVELPVLTMLRYLTESLEAQVPKTVFSELAASSGRAGRTAREAAFLGAVTGITTLRKILFGQPKNPSERRELLTALLFPSPTYIGWRFGVTRRFLLPLLYAYRPISYVAERLWWRAVKLPGLRRLTHRHRVTAEIEKLRA